MKAFQRAVITAALASASTTAIAQVPSAPSGVPAGQGAAAQPDPTTQTAPTAQTTVAPPSEAPTPAPATGSEEQADSSSLADIVVTAQRRQERLQDVPIAVTSIGGGQLAAAGVVDTAGLVNVVPGLSLGVTTQNFFPHLRGIGTTTNGPAIENPIALYVDGVYYGSQLLALGDTSDVDQITVLKGPQGTLFGRNATGGVLQLTTRDPGSAWKGLLRTDLDNYLTTRNYGYASGPVTNDLGVYLSGFFATQGEGWGKNRFDGTEIHRILHDVSLRNKWVWKPGGDTVVRLSLDYQDRKNNLGPNLRPAPGTTPLLQPYVAPRNEYDVDSYITNRNTIQSGGAGLTIEQGLGFARLVSITAYRAYDFSTIFNASLTAVPGLDLAFRQKGRQFSQELQLVSERSSRFNWVIGGFYFGGHDQLDPLTINLQGFYAPPNVRLFSINLNDTLESKSFSGFGQATLEILPRTNLTGGIRYTYERRTLDAVENGSINGNSIGQLLPPVSDAVAFNKVTYRASLDHKFTDDVLGYVSFNTGFKSGGFNGFDPTNPAYRPEDLTAYEGGLKTELFDRRVRLNVAGFYYDYTNIQVTRYTTTAVVYNGASARLYGVDVDAAWQVTPELQLNGGFELLNTKFTSFPDAQLTVPLPTGGVRPVTGSAAGNRIPYAPKANITFSADYTAPFGGGELTANVSNSYNSGYFSEPDNRLKVGSFNYLNASVAWTPESRRWSIKAYVKNLFDERVPAQLSSGIPQGYQTDFSNPPAIVGGAFTLFFGPR